MRAYCLVAALFLFQQTACLDYSDWVVGVTNDSLFNEYSSSSLIPLGEDGNGILYLSPMGHSDLLALNLSSQHVKLAVGKLPIAGIQARLGNDASPQPFYTQYGRSGFAWFSQGRVYVLHGFDTASPKKGSLPVLPEGLVVEPTEGGGDYVCMAASKDSLVLVTEHTAAMYEIETWTQLKRRDSGRRNFACVINENWSELYLIGGSEGSSKSKTFESLTLDAFSPDVGKWKSDTLELSVTRPSAAYHDKSILVLGGDGTATNSVQLIDTVMRTVLVVGHLAYPVLDAAAIKLQHAIYVIGGTPGITARASWQYLELPPPQPSTTSQVPIANSDKSTESPSSSAATESESAGPVDNAGSSPPPPNLPLWIGLPVGAVALLLCFTAGCFYGRKTPKPRKPSREKYEQLALTAESP